jgi:hypothetical protein
MDGGFREYITFYSGQAMQYRITLFQLIESTEKTYSILHSHIIILTATQVLTYDKNIR